MDIETVVNELIENYDWGLKASVQVCTPIHMDDFKKIEIARGLRRKGYKLAWWEWNSDTDHYKVEIEERG